MWIGRSFIRATNILSIKCLIIDKNIRTESIVSRKTELSRVKVPKISVPRFSGIFQIGRATGNNLIPTIIAKADSMMPSN